MTAARSGWPIPPALTAAFGLLVAMVSMSLYLSTQLERAAEETARAQTYGRAVADVLASLRDAETGQRGFLLTGEPRFLKPYIEARDQVLPALERVRTSEAAFGRAVYPDLAPPVSRKLTELIATVELEQQGHHEAAIARVRTGSGLASMTAARSILDRERGYVRAQTQAIADHSLELARLQTVGLVAGALAAIMMSLAWLRQSREQLREVESARSTAESSLAALRTENIAREEAEGQVRQLQKMESIGQLTGGIAHDFNNMLAVVIGSLELAKRRLRSEPDRADQCIDNASEGARRAAALTARLLAFARRQPLAPAPTDLNKLVGGMSELLTRTLGDAISIETVLGAGLWRCYADGGEIENAVLNLAINARDAMPEGGRLTIETANAHIDDNYARTHPEVEPGQYAAICVTDSGTGMTAEVIERAFDPFFTTKTVGKGTGLGLSQVFGFAKQSAGHVAIYSEVGAGTTVKLYLPRFTGATSEAEAAATIEPDLPRGAAGELVLVVEDEQRVRHFAVDVLGELGYTTLSAGSPAAALRILDETPAITLLFTDIIMPDMNGRELADAARKARPELPVLFTTGYTRNAVVHNGMLDVGVAFLPKPYTIAELARKIRDTIDGKGVNRRI